MVAPCKSACASFSAQVPPCKCLWASFSPQVPRRCRLLCSIRLMQVSPRKPIHASFLEQIARCKFLLANRSMQACLRKSLSASFTPQAARKFLCTSLSSQVPPASFSAHKDVQWKCTSRTTCALNICDVQAGAAECTLRT